MFDLGTLVTFCSGGSRYTGFVIGTCSYDGCSEPNAYVVRYIWKVEEDEPRKPYTIADAKGVELVTEYTDDFFVGGHWSATPDDRCTQWKLKREKGLLRIVPKITRASKKGPQDQ